MDEKKTSFQKLMDIINKIGNAILLNLLFLVSCIPVVTIGAAVSGLYSAVRFSIREESPYAGFKEGFTQHFLRNTLATVIALFVGLYGLNHLYVNISAMIADHSLITLGAIIPTGIHLVVFMAVVLFSTAMIPVNLYFENDLNGWIRDTWTLIGYAPLQVLAAALILWLPPVVTVWFPQWGMLVLLVFVAVYYSVMGVVATGLLKDGLIRILNSKREEAE